MSAETDSGGGHDPDAELPGFHDRLRRAYAASQDERWDDVVDILDGARSRALKRRAHLAKRGEIDV